MSAEEFQRLTARHSKHVRTSKYNVAPAAARTWRGRVYASKGEMQYAMSLFDQMEHGEVREIVHQPAVKLGEDFTYRPDFLVIPMGATSECYYADFKGMETKEFKRTKKLWAKYGRLTLHVVARTGKGFEVVEQIGPE